MTSTGDSRQQAHPDSPEGAKGQAVDSKASPETASRREPTTSTAPVASGDGANGMDSPTDSGSVSQSEKTLVEINDPPPPQVFIAVMGQTGTGKSSFINLMTEGNLEVGHGLSSCTQEVKTASTNINGIRVTFIDTPGFDDTSKDDGEILNLIGSWLKLSYGRNELLNGVIYLHRIIDNKFGGAGVRTLNTLKRICGTTNYKNIALVTTMWDEPGRIDAWEAREKQLKEGNDFWAHLIKEGAKLHRHDGKKETAMEIVKQILPRSPVLLEIQGQLSSMDGSVGATEAGMYITDYLKEQRKLYKERMESGSIVLDNNEVAPVLKEQFNKMGEDIEYLQVSVDDLVARAREAGAATPNARPKKTFLQKLLDMVTWNDRRVKQT